MAELFQLNDRVPMDPTQWLTDAGVIVIEEEGENGSGKCQALVKETLNHHLGRRWRPCDGRTAGRRAGYLVCISHFTSDNIKVAI